MQEGARIVEFPPQANERIESHACVHINGHCPAVGERSLAPVNVPLDPTKQPRWKIEIRSSSPNSDRAAGIHQTGNSDLSRAGAGVVAGQDLDAGRVGQIKKSSGSDFEVSASVRGIRCAAGALKENRSALDVNGAPNIVESVVESRRHAGAAALAQHAGVVEHSVRQARLAL